MAAFIFDASAIVKRYVTEIGTAWVRMLTDPAAGHEIFLTRITRVEVTAAVTRRGRGGLLTGPSATAILSQFRYNAAHQYNILEIIPALLTEAERLAEVHALRGYDAVQLAATMSLHQGRSAAGLSALTFISSDGELNTAARAEGLTVDDPNAHP
jgi:predicted nucleic acid-binding protein